jgi:hypothetical protein
MRDAVWALLLDLKADMERVIGLGGPPLIPGPEQLPFIVGHCFSLAAGESAWGDLIVRDAGSGITTSSFVLPVEG